MLRAGPLLVVPDTSWKPAILTEFEIGQAMAAIEGIARLEKPLAEIGTRIADEDDLRRDLQACIDAAGETRVFPWIRRVGEHVRFGYYAEPWVLDALDFLDRTELQPSDRHWITGLLFGYRSGAIQQFISARSRSRDAVQTRRPSRTRDRTGTALRVAR